MEDGDLKAVVIIKLPSSDNPSEGKVITAALALKEGLTGPNHSPAPDFAADPDDPDDGGGNVLPLHSSDVDDPTPELEATRRRVRMRAWGRKKSLFFRSNRAASMLFAALVIYFIWKYAPTTIEFEEGELQDNDGDGNDDDRNEVENWMFLDIRSKVVSMYSGADSNFTWKDWNASSFPLIDFNSLSFSSVDFNSSSTFVSRDMIRNNRSVAEANSFSSSAEDSTATAGFPVRGNVYPSGLYYVTIRLGNPAKEYFLDMDTGSELTWLQCDVPGAHCAKGPHPLFKPSQSELVDCSEESCSSVQVGSKFNCKKGSGQCDYDIQYADGGYSIGVLIRDRLAMMLSNRTLVYTNAIIGCGYNQQGALANSPSPTDGVLGLSSSSVSLPSQLSRQGLIKNIIAHCLIPGVGARSGYLLLGEKLIPSDGITWAPFIKRPSMRSYAISMSSVFYGETQIDTDSDVSRTAIFDSGTSYTYLVTSLYTAIVATIQKSLVHTDLRLDLSDNTLPLCWRRDAPIMSLKDVQHVFKPIVLEFKGSKSLFFAKNSRMQLSVEGYLINNNVGNICLGLLDAGIMGKDASNIIGDISMQGTLMVYDNENHRLGWMKSDCRKHPKVS